VILRNHNSPKLCLEKSAREALHDLDRFSVRRIRRITELGARVRIGEAAQPQQFPHALPPI